jgi:hypothetical protein
MGRRILRQDHGGLSRCGSGEPRCHRRELLSLGRRRCALQGSAIRSGGHGFCGIAPQAAAQHLSGARRDRSASSSTSSTRSASSRPSSRMPIWSSRPTASTADQRSRYADGSSRTSTCASAASSGSARNRSFPPSPSPSRTPSTAGSRSTPISSAGSFHRHRRNARGDLEGARPRSLLHGAIHRVLRAAVQQVLGRPPLMSNARHLRGSAWLNFNRVLCERWHHGNLVLIGDAAHTAHFGIGSGTKLAMEDAMSLVSQVAHAKDVGAGLEALPGGAQPRGAQAAERGSQPHGVVRERCGMCTSNRSSLPTACSPQASASAMRTSNCAIPATSMPYEGWLAAAAVWERWPGRRCFCRFALGACNSRIAWSSRRWRSTWPRTACPMTGI